MGFSINKSTYLNGDNTVKGVKKCLFNLEVNNIISIPIQHTKNL